MPTLGLVLKSVSSYHSIKHIKTGVPMKTGGTKSGRGSAVPAGWIGSLAHTPLPEVFRRIALEERSGDLQVTSASAIKTVYFDRGFVVFASSDLKSDRLGESLIEGGHLSRRDFALASSLMEGGKRKFGQALVQAGIVSEEELGRHVAAQVNRIVLSLFSVKQGMYSFDERPCIIPVELMVSLSIYRILIEGIRRMSSKKLILAGLPPLDTKVSIVEEPPFTLDFDRLRPVEKAVLQSVSKEASLRAIARTTGGNEGVVLRACYGLYAAGLLETATSDSRGLSPRVQEETGAFVLSEIRRKVEEREEGAGTPARRAEPGGTRQRPEPPGGRLRDQPPPLCAEVATPPEHDEARGQGWWAARMTSVAVLPEKLRSALSGIYDRAWAQWHELLAGANQRWDLSRLPSSAMTYIKLSVVDHILSFPHVLHRRLAQKLKVLDVRERATRLFQEEPPPATEPGSPQPEVSAADREVWEPHPFTPREADLAAGKRLEEERESPKLDRASPKPEWKDARGNDLSTESLGVPSWSMMDAPSDAKEQLPDSYEGAGPESEPAERGPLIETVGAPSWSIMDPTEEPRVSRQKPGSKPREEEPALELQLEEEELPSPRLRRTAGDYPPGPMVEPTHQPLTSLDSDLLVEQARQGDDEPSLLSPIPAEEIELNGESLEFDTEFENETLAKLPEAVEDLPPSSHGASEPGHSETEREKEDRREAREVTPAAFAAGAPVSSPEPEHLAESMASPAPDGQAEGELAASSTQSMHSPRPKAGDEEARLLRDVKLHFKFEDWEGVVPLLEQLVAISPGSARYRGLLARAMSRDPRMRKDAEKHFIEALRLSPQEPELHYWLGLYYKSYGLKSRAYHEFRTTLRFDPKHDGARKQLSGGPTKDHALGAAIKKFFG